MRGAWKSVRLGLVGLVACAAAGDAAAGLLGPSEHNRIFRILEHRPMVFFVAKGRADACGKGCDEWIAAVGGLDDGAAARFDAFMKTLGDRKLPIFFHSPGGHSVDGAQIGETLRARRMTAGVGRTEAKCRVFDKKDTACQNKIKAGEAIEARLATGDAVCASACVYAFAGGSSRQLGPGASLGVHASRPLFDEKHIRMIKEKVKNKEFIPSEEDGRRAVRRYYLDMGISPDLHDFASKTPHQRMYVLDRNEIARFGLETRNARYETSWTMSTDKMNVTKSVTRRTQSDPAEYLTLRLRFYCSTSRNIFIDYRRETPLDPDQATELLNVTFGDWFLDLKSSELKSGVETGAFPSKLLDETLTKFASAKTPFITEKMKAGAQDASEIRFSNDGLERALSGLKKECSVVKSAPAVPSIPHKPPPFTRKSS